MFNGSWGISMDFPQPSHCRSKWWLRLKFLWCRTGISIIPWAERCHQLCISNSQILHELIINILFTILETAEISGSGFSDHPASFSASAMAGIGITCQSPLKPGHFMVECDPTPNPAPSQSCEGSQHGGGKGSCKPEDFCFWGWWCWWCGGGSKWMAARAHMDKMPKGIFSQSTGCIELMMVQEVSNCVC